MSALPPLAAAWMSEVVPGPIAGEPGSDCADCVMCRDRVSPFRPDVVCCGYQPALPNFSVGRVLRDGDARAVASVRARLEARVAVGPLGLGVPPDYAAAWEEVRRTTGFGSDPALVCPHFDGGRCAIWAWREAVCTTWFCRIDGGSAGQEFWLAARALLQQVEKDLARWAARRIGPFGRTAEEREGWFVRSAGAVEGLSWAEIREIGGFNLHVRVRDVRAAHEARARAVGST